MKNLAVLLTILPLISLAQHDFDSLVQHYPEFQSKIQKIADTLDIFNDDKVLKVTLKSDFKNLIKQKYKDKYQEAILNIDLFDSVKLERKIQIKTRGNFRLKSCYFPPIKLNFKKKDAILTSLKEFDKIKLVNNCRMQSTYEKYIVAEYLTYKMYNLVSPYSFRVRLIDLTYIDTGRNNDEYQSLAILIEPDEQLMERLGGFIIEKEGYSLALMDSVLENRTSIFQYLIGNTDFDISSIHNMKIFRRSDLTKEEMIAIPYDFDYSGMVNTPYAIPNEKLRIEDVKQRLFMGSCQPEELFNENIRFFMDKRDELESLIKNCQYLEDRYREEILYYLNQGFENLQNQYTVTKTFFSSCKN